MPAEYWCPYGRPIQSDLGYPAASTSGPVPIQISDLSGYGSIFLNTASSVGVIQCHVIMYFHIATVFVTN